MEASPHPVSIQLRAAAARDASAREAARGATVEIGFEPSWVSGPDGTRHRLAEAYSRIVNAFLELHRRAPEAVLTIDDLVAVGWPGERPIAPSGANRVHVALAHLRRMGLRGVIERSSGGYRFVPGAVER